MEEELIKAKLKIVIVTVLTIFILIVVSIYIISNSISKIENKKDYYVLELDNKEEIIKLLEEDNIKYCESMYKIEYYYTFPHSSTTTIYCMEEENIILYESYKIIKYIKDNGTIERR